MRFATRTSRSAVVALLAGLAAAGCAKSYYYLESEAFVRGQIDPSSYKTAAILYFGYTEASTVVNPDNAEVTDVSTHAGGLTEQDVVLFSNALIDELSRRGVTLVERNRVNDLVREQGLVANEMVDLSDLEKIRRLGKLLKADLLIKGNVFTQLGGYRITGDQEVYYVALIGLAVRAIDSRTGQIVWADVSTVAERRVPDDMEDDYSLASDYRAIRRMVGAMVERFIPEGPTRWRRPACSPELEDRDGFEDDDGCPDPDNDRDGIEDRDDECPDQAEDMNGIEDEDGCPDRDADSDGDGIVNARDECPGEAEDRDGFEDDDGCPDPEEDDDGDGVVGDADQCPDQAEDGDGFEDEDGCPDPDNDGDRIVDAEDQCRNKAEVYNGANDDDGCPDEGAPLVLIGEGALELVEQIRFRGNSDRIVGKPSFRALDVVASILKLDTGIGLRVEGHTDSKGKRKRNLEISAKRAEAVRRYLIDQGIDASRLEAVGRGPDRPIDSNQTASGRAANRRVELIIVER